MGLPLHGILAHLFLEFIESGLFRFIKPKDPLSIILWDTHSF